MLYDDAGTQALTSLLTGLLDTGFTSTNVKATLTQTRAAENWRVGEALAESYLVHHRACHFPWPDGGIFARAGQACLVPIW